MTNLIIFLFGLILGIITTICLPLYFFYLKCPQCKKKKLVAEIITLSTNHWWEIKGNPCNQCEQEKQKVKETIEIF